MDGGFGYGGYYRECTDFVAWRLNRDGAPGWYAWGNADKWDDTARSKGIRVDHVPALGAVAQWDSMHVAYVAGYNADRSQVFIEEYNRDRDGTYGSRWISAASPTNYIHVHDLTATQPPPPDLDGDGTPDASDLCPADSGSPLFAGCPEATVNPTFAPNRADVSGDGRADYCRAVGTGNQVQCTVSTGSGFGATFTSPGLDMGYPAGRAWVDATGDGRADYCRVVGMPNDQHVACTPSTGSGFGATFLSAVLDWGYDLGRTWVDVTGDGRVDFCRVVGTGNQLQCTASTGSGFGATFTSAAIDMGYPTGRAWVDATGDGRADYCRVVGVDNHLASHVACLPSSGSGFGASMTSPVLDWGYEASRVWVDTTGDGRADFCRAVGTGNQLQCTATTGSGFGSTFTSPAVDAGYAWMRTWPGNASGPRTPSAPQSVAAKPGNTSATVSWTAPVRTGGLPLTGYKVTASPGGRTCTTTSARSCTVTGLTNGTGYKFTVQARNRIGYGPASAASAIVTPRPAL